MSKIEMLNPGFTIKLVSAGEDRQQARYIVECNGVEVDILADNDGLVVTVQKADGQELIGEVCHDWLAGKEAA